MSLEVKIRRVRDGFDDLPLPSYATNGAAGFDLRAAIDQPERLAPGERRAIPTGVAIALPVGYECQVRPRSGTAIRYGLTVVNAPGTVDADFRGEIMVLAVNLGSNDVVIERGDRLAQGVVARYERITFVESDELPQSERGEGGFGSTGRA